MEVGVVAKCQKNKLIPFPFQILTNKRNQLHINGSTTHAQDIPYLTINTGLINLNFQKDDPDI